MRRIILLAAILLCATGARATTYYVDYSAGSDSNAGTSKGAAWKHAPGMLGLTPGGGSTGDGCASTCASTTINPGDAIILKGGIIWPYTTLPWQPNFSGNATTTPTYGCAGTGCITITNDPTWNAGKVNSVTLARDLGGCNPSSPPAVSFSGGGGSSAAATALVIPSAAGSAEPQVAGFVYHVNVTNQGSGYTSNPSVTISGGGCLGITAQADITRPIIDAGSGSSIAWPVGTGSAPLAYGPGLSPIGSFLIIANLEIRNILNTVRASGAGIQTAMLGAEQGGSGHITYGPNNYVHGRTTTCILQSCIPGGWPANDQEQADKAIQFNNGNDEIINNFVENGDSYETGTSSTTCSTSSPCIFSEADIGGAPGTQGGWIHGNKMYSVRWLGHVGGSGSPALQEDHNEFWLVLYDVGTAHVNAMYVETTTGTNYLFDNIVHNCVSGSSNQQQMGNGTTQWIFNNIWWACPGTGTLTYGIDVQQGQGASGGTFHILNNTMLYASGTSPCLSSGSGSSFITALFVEAQNNFCISNQNPYFQIQQSGANWSNHAGSTVTANIQAASQITTLSTATSQGYGPTTLYGPTLSSNDTVTFAAAAGSANLSADCSGILVALCSDINGNVRPASGGWQAGAIQFGGGTVGPTVPSAILPLTLTVNVPVIPPPPVVPPIAMSPMTIPAATEGIAYSQQITATGCGALGTSICTCTVSIGALPKGLTLTPGCLLSGVIPIGTFTATSTVSFTVKAQ